MFVIEEWFRCDMHPRNKQHYFGGWFVNISRTGSRSYGCSRHELSQFAQPYMPIVVLKVKLQQNWIVFCFVSIIVAIKINCFSIGCLICDQQLRKYFILLLFILFVNISYHLIMTPPNHPFVFSLFLFLFCCCDLLPRTEIFSKL